MIFKQITPILYSSNVARSLAYYIETLGFESKWEFDDPPTFGGVSKDGVEIFFCENCQGAPGTWIFLMIDQIDDFYESLKARGAKILCAPENMEWGIREMVVEDPDGHKIRFAQNVKGFDREKSATELAQKIRIIERSPTVREYRSLVKSVNWSTFNEDEMVEKILAAAVHAVVAEDTESGEVVGCALVLGDNASFYYIKDVMVQPDWKGKRVGSALLQALTRWLETNARGNTTAVLITGQNLAPFYKQFGFTPVFGMQRIIHRSEKNS